MEPNDLTAPEDAIVQRLKAEIADIKTIQASPDIDAVQDRAHIAPAIHVLYTGYQVGKNQGDGIRTEVVLSFGVLTVVKQVRGTRNAAGDIMAKIIYALCGWTPAPGFRRMQLANTSFPPNYQPGLAIMGQEFTTRTVTEGKG